MIYRDEVERFQETYFRDSNINLRNTVLGQMIKDEYNLDWNVFKRDMKRREMTPEQCREQKRQKEEEEKNFTISLIKRW